MHDYKDLKMKTRLQRLFFPLLPYVRRELLTAARGGGGTTIHYLYGYVPPNGDFEAPDLERGIHFRGVF